MAAPAPALFDTVSRAGAPQRWRGMGSDGGRRGAMSNRWGGRFSAPDPRVGCTDRVWQPRAPVPKDRRGGLLLSRPPNGKMKENACVAAR